MIEDSLYIYNSFSVWEPNILITWIFDNYLPYEPTKDSVADGSEIVSCDDGKNLFVAIELLAFCCGINIGFDCGRYLKVRCDINWDRFWQVFRTGGGGFSFTPTLNLKEFDLLQMSISRYSIN